MTRFVRVSQAWAGTNYGFFAMPRVGEEVVVAYLDGDPDEPLIVGRVHNPINPNPIDPSAPDKRAISVWKSKSLPPEASGFNMVLMDDKADGERLELHAQKDFISVVEHDSTTRIKNDEKQTVDGSATHVIKKGFSHTSGGVAVGTGNIRVDGNQIWVDGFTITLNAQCVNLYASDTVTIEAPTINIGNGSGAITINGATVSILGAIKLN
jgi:type VI secretion system secreted protein VgrG